MLDASLDLLVVAASIDLTSLLGERRSPYQLRVPMLSIILLMERETGAILKLIPLQGGYNEVSIPKDCKTIIIKSLLGRFCVCLLGGPFIDLWSIR